MAFETPMPLTLGAGLGLVVAVRAGLGEDGWAWVAAGLLASGPAHATDVLRRWAKARRKA